MPALTPLRTVIFAAVAVAAAAPPSAGAATVSLDKACYREGSSPVGTGGGFTPNTPISITLDGGEIPDPNPDPNREPVTSDAAGNVSFTFGVGSPPGAQRRYTLGASDGTNTAQTVFTATDLDVGVRPASGNPGRRKRVTARGFDPGRILRFHVRGPRRKNGRVGRVKGPCGKVNKRVKIFKSTYPTGVYTVQFDQRRRYSVGSSPRVVFTVRIFRVARASIAGAAFAAGETWTPLD